MREAHENGHEARRRRTREAVLASASELFHAQGYDATTVAEIARRANVSERTFYVHFPAKEDVLFAHVDDFTALALGAAHDSPSPHAADRVQAALRVLIDASTTDEALARQASIRASLGARGEFPRALATQLLHLARGLTREISARTDAGIADVAPMVGAALGAVEGAGIDAALRRVDGEGRRAAMRGALDAALRGFRPSATTPEGHDGGGRGTHPSG